MSKACSASMPLAVARFRAPRQPAFRSRPSAATVLLFLALASYVALPVFKIPLLDLSLSALIFAFLCLNVFFGSGLAGLGDQRLWVALAGWLWVGVLLALASNCVGGVAAKIDLGNWRLFLRLSYWLLLFVLTAFVATEANVWNRLVTVLGVMIFLTAMARWGEIALFGNAGAWTGTKLQTQNIYGILFSTYTPYLLVPLCAGRRGRLFAAAALLLVWGAMALNGSRGSWVAAGLGTAVFFLMYLKVSPRKIIPLAGLGMLASLGVLVLVLSPPKFKRAILQRAATFQDLDRDKSWNTRRYQVRKGWELFQEHPLVGVGLGGFARFVVNVETDRTDASIRNLSSRSAHNAFIGYLAETGLAGSVPLAVLLLCLTGRGYRAAIRLGRRRQLWALAVFVSFLSLNLHLLVLQGIYNTGTWLAYGLTAGMITAAGRAAGSTQTSRGGGA